MNDWKLDGLLLLAFVACVSGGYALCLALTPEPSYNDDVRYTCQHVGGNPVDVKDAHGYVLAIRCDR